MDVGSVYGSYYETAKSYMGLRKEEKQAGFAEKVTDKSQVSSEDMTLEEYKEYFNEKMSGLYTHPSQRNRNDIIDITDAAYKRMQTDPEYEKKILDALAKNKAVNFGNYIPQISYMHIDDTYEKCYGYTQGMKENDGYSGSSSAKGTDAGRQKKARQKELLEEYLEKRAQMKEFQQEALEEKIAKQELERSRLTKAWSSKRQMAMASNAYDAKLVLGPLACGAAVVGNSEIVDDMIKQHSRKTVGLDMESYGMFYATNYGLDSGTIPICLKSISDFADEKKGDGYQKYAAYTSAGFARYLIESVLPYING